MKKFIFYIAIIIVAIASCTKEIADTAITGNGPVQSISVAVDSFTDYETRTSVTVDESGAARTSAFAWSTSDVLGVFPINDEQGHQQIAFKFKTSTDASHATFTGTGWGLICSGGYTYVSYYPYYADAACNNVEVSYANNLNQTANGSASHACVNDFLYSSAVSPESPEQATFNYHHLGALVEFEVTVPEVYRSRSFTKFQVTAPSAIFPTAGTYDPTASTVALTPTAYTDVLTLNLNGGRESDGFAPDANSELHLFFILAPSTVAGQTLSLKLWDSKGTVYTGAKTIAAGKNIEAQDFKTYTCNVAVKDITEAENLSADGTANCYIVPEYGKYKFLANVKGNGIVPSGMTESSALDMAGCTAEVIWETVNTNNAPDSGDIVSVSGTGIDGDYIVFTATGKFGNALIALKDAGSNILWSWHIWSTDADLVANEQTYGGANMMDRNLGALSATPGNGLTIGFFYQWGRPCPITGGSSVDGAFSSTRMATTGADDLWVEEETDVTKGTLAYSAANPTHFICASTSNYYKGQTSGALSDNWLWTADATTGYATAADMPLLWSSAKTMYDPCPVGWKVPAGGSAGVWQTAGFNTGTFGWNATEKGRTFTSPAAYYPAVGYRGSGTNARLGGMSYFGYHGRYWSSTPYTYSGIVKEKAMNLNFGETQVYAVTGSYRAYGYAVRPCQE